MAARPACIIMDQIAEIAASYWCEVAAEIQISPNLDIFRQQWAN
jgi:hypothetical protein